MAFLFLSDKNVEILMPLENLSLSAAVCGHGPENRQSKASDFTDSGLAGCDSVRNAAAKDDEPVRNEDLRHTISGDSAALPQAQILDSSLDSSHRDESKTLSTTLKICGGIFFL